MANRRNLVKDIASLFAAAGHRAKLGALLAFTSLLALAPVAAQAGDQAPAMVVPGQFNVTPQGAASYSIPIPVPPGTAGVVPSISLEYSSNGGDGIMGLGWSLTGIPSITLCPRTVAQDGVHGNVNFNTSDRFCFEGQRLMVISGAYGADGSEYRTEIDTFTRVIAHGSGWPSWFEVHTKSGQVMQFGNTANARLLSTTTVTVQRGWLLNKLSDTKGNYLTVTYTSDQTNGQAYPTRIDYTGNTTVGSVPYNSVQFTYNTSRPDVTPAYQGGAMFKTTVLLTDVKTYQGANLVQDYQIAYRLGSTTTHSRVTSVAMCDGASHCLPATTFTWQGGTGSLGFTNTAIALWQNPNIRPTIAPGDFNGDGITDAVVMWDPSGTPCPSTGSIYLGFQAGYYIDGTGLHTYSPPLGLTASGYTASYVSPAQPSYDCGTAAAHAPADYYASGFYLGAVDINGDGYADVIVRDRSTGSNNYYGMINNKAGYIPQAGGAISKYTLGGDFNGDGRTDWFQQATNGTNSTVYLSVGDGTYTTGTTLSGMTSSNGYYFYSGDFDGDGCSDLMVQHNVNTIYYSCNPAVSSVTAPVLTADVTNQVLIADFNGDGKSDILLAPVNGTNPTLYLSTGTGFTTTTITSFNLGSSFNCGSAMVVYTGDWNGDGKTDIVVVPKTDGHTQHCGNYLFISSGTDFVAAGTVGTGYTINGNTVVAIVADWNNDGASDIWVQAKTGDNLQTPTFVPEMIVGIANGIGATTTVGYNRLNNNAPGATVYTKGTGATYPTQDVIGASYVVSDVEASTGIAACSGSVHDANCYVSTYAYAGMKADLQGRGPLGFSSVSVTDPQTNTVQTTNYRTDFPYVGMVASATRTHSGATLSSTTNTYAAVSLGSGRWTVELKQSVNASNDLDGTALPSQTTTYTYDCDSTPSACYGDAKQIVATTTYGGSTVQTVTNTNWYTDDTTNWYLGRLTQATVETVVGASDMTRTTTFSYDSASGLLMQEVVEPNNCEVRVQTDYTYDNFGNKHTVQVSGAGCAADSNVTAIQPATTTLNYDPSNGEFQTSGSNALGQSESWAYTAGYSPYFGYPSSHVGPNGQTTNWSFDFFGRATLESRADGTKTAIGYGYCSGVNSGTMACPANGAFYRQTETFASDGVTQIGAIVTVYFDNLSRSIGSDTQGFDGTIVHTTTLFDAKGRVHQTSRPYFSAPQYTTLTYDDLGRVTRTDQPNGSYVIGTFHGLSVSATNNLGQVTTTLKNPLGQNVTVTDAAGKNTYYTYDAEGDLLTINDAGNWTTNTYDIRGHKLTAIDPDMGSWSYVIDVAGRLVRQIDQIGNASALVYDVLDRVTERRDTALGGAVSYTNWYFDHAANGIGKLGVSCTSTISNPSCVSAIVSSKTYSYDSTGRPSGTTINVDSTAYQYNLTYNTTNGAPDSVTYPSGLVTKTIYNTYGFGCRITDGTAHTCNDASDVHVLWTATTRDAEMHLTGQTAGNNAFTTTSTFDAQTGLMTNVRAGVSNGIAQFDYVYDTIGNLLSRSDGLHGVFEFSCYDPNLNRLTKYAAGNHATACDVPGTGGTAKTVTYDAWGNITNKSDVGAYAYAAAGSTRPHGVNGVTGSLNGVTNPYFYYDPNGNMTCESTSSATTYLACASSVKTVSWTPFNMVAAMTQATTTIAFAYDSDRTRLKQTCSGPSCVTNTTYYLNDAASGAMSEVAIAGATTTWHDFLQVDGKIIAERFLPSGGSATWKFFVLDHLGSIAVVVDSAGTVSENLSYDAWGRRRDATTGLDLTQCTVTSVTTRGFINQEQMDGGVCLDNLNARIYDPTLGRFLSADPEIGDLYTPQQLNRYTYSLNNPLSLSDPSGLCFLGCFFKNPIVQTVVSIAIMAVVPYAFFSYWSEFASAIEEGTNAGLAAAATAGAASGAATAGMSGGNILRGMLSGAFSAVAFAEVGSFVDGLEAGRTPTVTNLQGAAIRVGLHGLVGGISSTINKGNFGAGFLAAGFGVAADSVHTGIGDFGSGVSVGDAFVHAVAGGLGSMAGGGKFENGAETAGFGYLFNQALSGCGGHPNCPITQKQRDAAGAVVGPFFRTMFEVGLFVFGGEVIDIARGALWAGDEIETASFAQRTFSRFFSKEGSFAGRAVEDVAADLRAGRMSVSDVPVQYIVRDGNTLLLNTRSAQALEQAGIPRAQWEVIDMTGDAASEARLTAQLQRNGLTSAGTRTVRQSGGR